MYRMSFNCSQYKLINNEHHIDLYIDCNIIAIAQLAWRDKTPVTFYITCDAAELYDSIVTFI